MEKVINIKKYTKYLSVFSNIFKKQIVIHHMTK